MAALLASELARMGHQVSLVSLFDPAASWIEAELRSANVSMHFLGKRPGLDLRMIPRLARVLRRERPETVHTHLHTLKYVLPACVAWRKCSVVHTLHNLAQHEIERSGQIFQRCAFRLGVAPVAIGAAVAESIREVYSVSALATIPNGIPVARYRAADGDRESTRSALSLPSGVPVFLTVGRLNAQKDHATLLRAFADSRLRALDARLVIAGTGELRRDLEEQVRELDLSARVQFLGVRGDVPALLAAADVFVLASRWEGNPLVVMEAMASGRPVVATRVGCVPELTSSATGRLVLPGDSAALADALVELGADRELAGVLGCAAAETAAARFDVSVMAQAYADFFARRTGDLLPTEVSC